MVTLQQKRQHDTHSLGTSGKQEYVINEKVGGIVSGEEQER